MALLNYFLGILTLKFEEISTFLMIKDNLSAVVTGAVIPLALLPEWMIAGMRFLPFYYVTYLPSMLFIGKCEDEAVTGLLVLSIWCIFFIVLNTALIGVITTFKILPITSLKNRMIFTDMFIIVLLKNILLLH